MTNLQDLSVWRLQRHTRQHVSEILSRWPSLTVSSGRRTRAHNRRVGGSPRSYHLGGRAADLVGPIEAMTAARNYARSRGAKEAFIHNAGTGTHLHVAW